MDSASLRAYNLRRGKRKHCSIAYWHPNSLGSVFSFQNVKDLLVFKKVFPCDKFTWGYSKFNWTKPSYQRAEVYVIEEKLDSPN